MRIPNVCCLLVLAAAWFATAGMAEADLTDFTNWSLVQDPPDPGFTASVTPTQASLFAGATGVAPGTDIGYNTVNQNGFGYVFNPASDFTIAIDYNLSFVSANGALGLGFGIGEDAAGANSAGVAFITNDGLPFLNFAGAARINDVNEPIQDLGLAATLIGSLFIEYDAATGDIIVGASQTPGAGAPTAFFNFSGLQNSWNGSNLGASFFIRSETIDIFAPNGWEGGNATAIFSNFRILDGMAMQIPEPGTFTATGLLLGLAFLSRRRRRA